MGGGSAGRSLQAVWDGEIGIGWDAAQRALATAIQHSTRTPVDFDELLVMSGDAFAAMSSDVYQDVTYLAGAIDVMTQASRAYGFSGQWRFPDSFEEALGEVGGEIDAGRPVPAGGAAQPYGCPPWGLVTGYCSQEPLFCFAGYPGGLRWMPVRGDCGRQDTGPWNGRVRGLLTQQGRFWFDRPLFILGPPTGPPTAPAQRRHALELARSAMQAGPHRIDYWGGVTYYFGLSALEHLSEDLRHIDATRLLDQPLPADAYDWYEFDEVISSCAQIVMRGRGAALRVFPRWAREDTHLAPLAQALGPLESSVQAAQAIYSAATPAWLWEQSPADIADPAWREDVADHFSRILDNDRTCARVITGVLDVRS